MRQVPAIALSAVALSMFGCGDGGKGGSADCGTDPGDNPEVAVFRLLPGTEAVSPESRAETIEFACRRLDVYGIAGTVEAAGEDRIKVWAERGAGDDEGETTPIAAIAMPGSWRFYDWEENLVGNPQGYASAFDAAKAASRRKPVAHCPACASSVPLYFRFSDFTHEGERLGFEGATPAKTPLGFDGAPSPTTGPVIKVPVGTIVVAEEMERGPDPVHSGERWYVLRDEVAVSEREFVGTRVEADTVTGTPTVALELTGEGQRAFRRLTRNIADRGSGHFAIVLGGVLVASRPTVAGATAPEGIDASHGVQLSGFFDEEEDAEEAVGILGTGSSPLALEPIRGSGGY